MTTSNLSGAIGTLNFPILPTRLPLICNMLDGAFIDRADIKQYIGL